MLPIKHLDILFSRQSILKLSKNPKKIYKNGLVALFITGLQVGNLRRKLEDFNNNIHFCYTVLNNPKSYQNAEYLKKINRFVQSKLRNAHVKNPDSEDTINKIIELMREVIKANLNNTRYLMTFDDLNRLIDVKALLKALYKNSNPNISHHHWIEIDLERSIVPTFPDFITYGDLISLWNIYLEKIELWIEIDRNERLKIRTLESELHALLISLWTQSVTFVESYLYYVFFNIKKSGYALSTVKAQGFINVSMPDDNQIIDSLIIPEFGNQGNKDIIAKIKELHKDYKGINNIRNRFIHASAFDENKQSHLLPLVSSNSSDLIIALQVCTDLVIEIEKTLPKDLKILFWWDSLEHPNYKEHKRGNYIQRTDI